MNIVGKFLGEAKKPLIVVVGPTAGGKTGLSLEIARELSKHDKPAEIVNADSRQLYRGLDIGTAKISSQEMRDVPHHLLSVLSPDEPVTIAWYQKEAERVIDDIHGRGAIPLLVGGSMLYVSSVIDGLKLAAPGNSFLRGALGMVYDADQGVQLHKRLTEIDPESAAAIPRENKTYLIRALEIYELTGKKKSDVMEKSACPYDLLIFGVARPREELHERISSRIDEMFASGWIDEVRALIASGYNSDAPALQSHGYSEIVEWIANGENEQELNDVKKKIAARTRQYAKRQMTWWKRDGRIRWISC